jgi:predicted DNA-binding protein
MDQTLTVRIPDKMRKELEYLSQAENKPVSDLVRESLRKYLSVERFRMLRKTVLPYADAAGILTDEDLFDRL